MPTILFYDGKYKPGAQLQNLGIDQVNATFGFEYMESNLTEVFTECLLHEQRGDLQALNEFFITHKILNNYEQYISIHKPSEKTGYGLVAVKHIAANTVVFEYLGERNKKVSDSVYSLSMNGQFIEAKFKGNLARFSLHLPNRQPYLVEEEVKLANLGIKGILCADGWHTFLITKEAVKPGDEMGWHYGYDDSMYINPKTGEFFEAKPISAVRTLELYSPMINECKATLKQDLRNALIMQNLTHMLHLRGDANMLLKNYNDAYLDYADAADNLAILSLGNKAKYLSFQMQTMIPLLIKMKKSCESFFDSFYDTAYSRQSSFEKIEQLAEFVKEHRNNKCVIDTYVGLVNMSKKLLPLLQRPAGFCTEEQADTLAILDLEYIGLHEILCDFHSPSCEHGVKEYECRYIHDIFTNCRPLIGLEEIVTNGDELN